MGRVAKYKKIKSCDPYSKKNGGKQSMVGVWGLGDNGRRPKKRSATATALRHNKLKRKKKKGRQEEDGFDLPPSGGDDFDLSDIFRIKKIKPPGEELLLDDKAKKPTAAMLPAKKTTSLSEEAEARTEIIPDPMLEEKRASRILKIQPDRPSNDDVGKVERFPGESRKAFEKRVKSETRQLIRNEKLQRRNPEKAQRKKEFLNKKKRRATPSRRDASDDEDDYRGQLASGATDGFITGEQAVARVAFGDQVERPPVFVQLPRGAAKKEKVKPKSARDKNASIEAEQRAMEKMRQKVQAQYALVKAKRRKAGDFHL